MSEEHQNETTKADVVSNGGAESVDHHGHIEQVDLQTEMQRSYLDYAMAVIITAPCRMCVTTQARAPPRDLRDVRRRLPPGPILQ